MRPPRVTMRWLLVAVAVVALGLWGSVMWRRRQAYQVLAQKYAALGEYLSAPGYVVAAEPLAGGGVWTQDDALRYYRALRLKYERAARCPWRSVEDDPPLPAIAPL